jgi:hypothetical protein
MLFTSPVYSQTSGSIAGITYGHGRSGMFSRAKSKPTDPNSFRQATIRQIMASLMPKWGEELDDDQRAAWNLYGSNVPWTNALGQTIFLTGHQHFLRCNAPRLQAGIAIVLAAPTIFDLGTFTSPTFAVANNAPQAGIGFEQTDHWATHVGGFLLVWPGKAVGPGRNFYRRPWRFGGKITGDPAPPITPFPITPRWPWSIGNIAWITCRVIQTDGRLSFPIVLGPRTIVSE